MTGWTHDELDRLATAEEVELTTLRADGTPRKPVTIWIVCVGDDVYIRSARGAAGSWYRAAHAHPEAHISGAGLERDVALPDAGDGIEDAVDNAYRTKYAQYPSYVEPLVRTDARATTLKLVSHGSEVR